eukprot:m.1238384 g.1238384  ORF g.1238384 m.1238384 type:complete len:1029 (-) comp24670_c1_seq6:93-3179(-)
MRTKKLEFTIDAPWELVIAAYDAKMYEIPTPDQPEILSMEFSNFHWDEETNVTTLTRLSRASIPCPSFILRSLTSETELHARFNEMVDRANRRLVTLMVNDNLTDVVMIKETTTFTVHPEFPLKTLLVVECNMNFLSSSWVIGKVEGIVVKIYVNAIKKARVKDAKKIAAFREQLRKDGKDESTLLSRSEEEAREFMHEQKLALLEQTAEDELDDDDDDDDEFYDAESDEEVLQSGTGSQIATVTGDDSGAADGSSESAAASLLEPSVDDADDGARMDIDATADTNASIPLEPIPRTKQARKRIMKQQLQQQQLQQLESDDQFESGSPPYEDTGDGKGSKGGRRSVREKLYKAGAVTFWAATAATRRTYHGMKIAAKTTGHVAVRAKRQVGRVRGRGRKTRGDAAGSSGHRDSLRRTSVYNQAKSHPYAWQQLQDSPDYEMALVARKLQIESDWLKAGVLTGGLDASAPGSPVRPKQSTKTSPRESSVLGDDNFADDERDGNVSADPTMSRQESAGSITGGDGGGGVLETAEEIGVQPDAESEDDDVVVVEQEKDEENATSAIAEQRDSLVSTSSVATSRAQSAVDETPTNDTDNDEGPGTSGADAVDSTAQDSAELRVGPDTFLVLDQTGDNGIPDQDGNFSATSDENILDENMSADQLDQNDGVVQPVDLREEYDLICAELDRLTQENLMGAVSARDGGAAVDGGMAGVPDDYAVLLAMDNIDALSSDDPVVAANGRLYLLQRHVEQILRLYSGCTDAAALDNARDMLNRLAADLGTTRIDTASPVHPPATGQSPSCTTGVEALAPPQSSVIASTADTVSMGRAPTTTGFNPATARIAPPAADSGAVTSDEDAVRCPVVGMGAESAPPLASSPTKSARLGILSRKARATTSESSAPPSDGEQPPPAPRGSKWRSTVVGGISRVKKASMSVKKAAAQKLQQLPSGRHSASGSSSTLDKQPATGRGTATTSDVRSLSANTSLVDLSVPGASDDALFEGGVAADGRRPQSTSGVPAQPPSDGCGVDLLS